jgi:hypothetical protein
MLAKRDHLQLPQCRLLELAMNPHSSHTLPFLAIHRLNTTIIKLKLQSSQKVDFSDSKQKQCFRNIWRSGHHKNCSKVDMKALYFYTKLDWQVDIYVSSTCIYENLQVSIGLYAGIRVN